jgi:hypothetical protein
MTLPGRAVTADRAGHGVRCAAPPAFHGVSIPTPVSQLTKRLMTHIVQLFVSLLGSIGLAPSSVMPADSDARAASAHAALVAASTPTASPQKLATN